MTVPDIAIGKRDLKRILAWGKPFGQKIDALSWRILSAVMCHPFAVPCAAVICRAPVTGRFSDPESRGNDILFPRVAVSIGGEPKRWSVVLAGDPLLMSYPDEIPFEARRSLRYRKTKRARSWLKIE
jgi:hypothetical protein